MCAGGRFTLALLFAALLVGRAQAGERLLLALWIDGRDTASTVSVTMDNGHLMVSRTALARAGMNVDGEGDIDVTGIAGVSATVDGPNQRLVVTAPPSLLARQVYDLRPSEHDDSAPSSATGAVLNYEVSGAADDIARPGRTGSGGGTLALDVFTPDLLFSADGFANLDGSGARLDTALEFDNSAALTRFVIGDAVSGSLDWSRAVRFGGIEYARDFTLRPGLVTQPLPAFFGNAAVPTTVDVFSGGARVFEQDVPPGPFELRDLPVVTGAGTATVVTTDVLGRQSAQSVSLYTTADLLAPGLTGFAFDAGFLRRGYGERSFAYATPMAAVTVRHGLDNNITIQGHGEAAPGLGLLGLGAQAGIGDLGAITLDGAGSTSTAGSGWFGAASFETRSGDFTAFGSLTATSGAFRDLASVDGTPPDRLRYQLGVSAGIGRGSLALSWIGSKPQSGESSSFVTGSFSQNWSNGAVFSITALRDLSSGRWSAQAALTVPVGDGYASVSPLYDDGRASVQAMVDKPVNPDGGFGYRVQGEAGDVNRAEANASWLGTKARIDGDIAVDGGKVALRGGVQGALVLIDGSLFATRDTGAAVALVDTGLPGVRVYRENRPVAVSDSGGQALLTQLAANADNHLSVEARDYPIGALLADTNRTVMPRRLGGIVVDFAPVSFNPAFVTIETGARQAPPAGTHVEMPGMPGTLLIGNDGKLFIPDLKTAGTVEMVVRGKRCLTRVEPQTPVLASGGDPLLCLREADDAG